VYVFSALTLVLGTGTILFGAYVLIQEHRSRAHQVFFALCVSAGCWNLLASITLSTATEQGFWAWFRAGSFFLILYISLYLHFALVLTEARRGKWLLAASYAISATSIMQI
jgi:hypothetical protein